MHYVIVFLLAFLQILLANFQVRNAAHGKLLWVFITSCVLALATVYLQRSYQKDDLAAILFMIGCPLGAVTGVWLHMKVFKKKEGKSDHTK